MAFELKDARLFVDPNLAHSQLPAADAARKRHLPADGKQRRVLLVVRGYLRLPAQVIDGRVTRDDGSAEDIERIEAVSAHYLAPPKHATIERAAVPCRRAADTGAAVRQIVDHRSGSGFRRFSV